MQSPHKGDIVIMDNLAAHKVHGVRTAIESAGAKLRANHFLNLRSILSSSLGFVAIRLRVGAIAL